MNEIKLSVIIPTHNRIGELRNTLDSLKMQSLPANEYEIVVVDDGSSPPVRLECDDQKPDCTVVRLEGLERSAARNAGAAIARGSVLVFIDDDMTVCPDFLLFHLRAHQEWPDVLTVGSVRLSDSFLATPYGRFRQSLEQNGIPRTRGPQKIRNLCTAANMSTPREVFQGLGGFDSELKTAEDQDLALRHTARGGMIAYIPEAEAIHNDSATDIKNYCLRTEWGAHEVFAFVLRYPDWPDNIEREKVNGPLKIGREPFSISVTKMMKVALAKRPIMGLLFLAARLLERLAPNSIAMDRIHRLLLGIHILRGYRSGRLLAVQAGKQAAIPNERLVES